MGVRLAELLATRLCHDLAGPLGGLNMALAEVPRDAEALPLALDAMRNLKLRFALLRAAWGEAQPELGAAQLVELARGLPNAARLQLVIDLRPAGAVFAPLAGRAALNLLLLAAECLPRGGRLALSGEPGGQMLLSLAGPRAAWPAGFAGLLAEPATAWTALHDADGVRALQAPLTVLLAAEAGARGSLLLARVAETAPQLLMDFHLAT